jgi:hypothetical protein
VSCIGGYKRPFSGYCPPQLRPQLFVITGDAVTSGSRPSPILIGWWSAPLSDFIKKMLTAVGRARKHPSSVRGCTNTGFIVEAWTASPSIWGVLYITKDIAAKIWPFNAARWAGLGQCAITPSILPIACPRQGRRRLMPRFYAAGACRAKTVKKCVSASSKMRPAARTRRRDTAARASLPLYRYRQNKLPAPQHIC